MINYIVMYFFLEQTQKAKIGELNVQYLSQLIFDPLISLKAFHFHFTLSSHYKHDCYQCHHPHDHWHYLLRFPLLQTTFTQLVATSLTLLKPNF